MNFEETLMEKHAGWLGNTWGKIPWVQKYRQISASPSFKAKKTLGTVALGVAPSAYVAHQISKAPDYQNVGPQH